MVQLINSQISTSVGGVAEKSDGGNITIDPQFVVLQNSQIIAQAFAGAGGAITIIATSAFIADPLSIVDASSTTGHQRNRQYPVAAAECRWRADGFDPGILQRGRAACPTVRGAGRGRQVQHLRGRRP